MAIDIEAIEAKYEEEFINFDRIQNKRNKRPDIHAFLLLDELIPGKSDIVCHASHDEICLDIDEEELAKVATEEQIVELMRCGVRFGDGLRMFV